MSAHAPRNTQQDGVHAMSPTSRHFRTFRRPRPKAGTCCPVVELRQYTMNPGMRDTLIELFEREFIESQEAHGAIVIGQFRDLDDPDRYVWLRGFRDMPHRAEALATFYGGPVWQAHRDTANATIADSDNVLLLRPDSALSGLALDGLVRPAPGEAAAAAGLVIATIYSFAAPVSAGFVDFFEHAMMPQIISAGASIAASFITEESPNTFPRLPVREGEHVFVWLARFADQAAYGRSAAALAGSARWREETWPALTSQLILPVETLRLAPTARSLLRG
jgi:hypothetical protein